MRRREAGLLHRPSLWVRGFFMLAIALVATPGLLLQATGAQDTASIRFAFWGDPAELEAYQAVIDGFEAAHPGIDVTADYTPGQSDYNRKVATDFAASDPPEIFLTNYRNFGQYAAAGALEPVGPYLKASEQFGLDDFYTEPMDAFRYRGGDVVCMPQNISSLVVYYNVDMFEANRIPLPTSGWTWDTFIEAAAALTQDIDGDGFTDQFGVVVESSLYRMTPFIWSAGGEIVDDPDNPTQLTIDSAAARAGIEAFLNLGVMGANVVPPEAEVAAEADLDRFMRGGAGMYLQSRRPVPSLREIEGFNWDVASLPVLNEPATVLHSDAFCMATGAANANAAWAFIEYATGEEGQAILAATGRTVPSMISVAESEAFLVGVSGNGNGAFASSDGPPPASNQVYLDNVAIMHRLPSISTWPEVEDAFNAEFDRAFYVPVDIDAAIEAAIEGAQPAIDRAIAGDGA